MRVIGLVGMRQHAIGERRIHGGGANLRADDRRFGGATKRCNIADRHPAGTQLRAGHHRRECIQNVMACLLDDGIRKRPHRCLGNVLAQLARRRAYLIEKGNHIKPSYPAIVLRQPAIAPGGKPSHTRFNHHLSR
jgi:hypothetical protein